MKRKKSGAIEPRGNDYRTQEGKIKHAIKAMIHGQRSRLLRRIRYCNVCPLGAKLRYVRNRDGVMEQVPVPAKCQHYRKNGKGCPIDKIDFINRCKYFYQLADNDNIGAMQIIAHSSAVDGEMAAQIETMLKGHPSEETRKHRELAISALEKAERLRSGEKHVVVSSGVDLSDVMDAIIKKRKAKVIDAEVVEDVGETQDKEAETVDKEQCEEQPDTEEENKEAPMQTEGES